MKYLLLVIALIAFKPRSQDLYVMYSPYHELYKVGKSNKPHRRVKEVDREINGPVVLLKVYPKMGRAEKKAHRMLRRNLIFKNNGTVGTEWFVMKANDHFRLDSMVLAEKLRF